MLLSSSDVMGRVGQQLTQARVRYETEWQLHRPRPLGSQGNLTVTSRDLNPIGAMTEEKN